MVTEAIRIPRIAPDRRSLSQSIDYSEMEKGWERASREFEREMRSGNALRPWIPLRGSTTDDLPRRSRKWPIP